MSGNCTCLTSQCRPLRGSCSRTGCVASAGIDSSYPPPHPLHSRKQRIVDQYLQLCSGIGTRRCSYQSSDAFSLLEAGRSLSPRAGVDIHASLRRLPSVCSDARPGTPWPGRKSLRVSASATMHRRRTCAVTSPSAMDPIHVNDFGLCLGQDSSVNASMLEMDTVEGEVRTGKCKRKLRLQPADFVSMQAQPLTSCSIGRIPLGSAFCEVCVGGEGCRDTQPARCPSGTSPARVHSLRFVRAALASI